ncbi:ABC transporter ATP-binding protein [Virgibacillus halodenitrificans]|uniref:ABC transporter ATP-binding protein n=1 Tax=Virgibacillus halodenitrificans TaxID=1482 RepID=UPI002DB7554C|nr:ABC transporter ATP-binding protein [Virgibacillus halodenitrificans]MEC2159757.1 ABC transporter ATP-binding protein [Virgibacillus halodenitrificans]
MTNNEVLMEIKNLKTHFNGDQGLVKAVDGVSISVKKGEAVAIVGESGCGKSVTSNSIMGLVQKPGRIVGGEIWFDNKDLTKIPEREYRKLRGDRISMIFQEPLTSLNPVFTIGNQLDEILILHKKLSKKQAKLESIKMLKKVGIPRPEKVYKSYSHSLSGGMRQRVMIAIALSCDPELLIADEPTTALDVSIQAQILHLMRQLSKEYNTAIIMITHDLGVVAEVADRVVVMYAGRVVEEGDVFTIFKNPKHPYTKGLLQSTPTIHQKNKELNAIKGTVPTPSQMPKGCRFNPRCPMAMDVCFKEEPDLLTLENDNMVRCWLYDKKEEKPYAASH